MLKSMTWWVRALLLSTTVIGLSACGDNKSPAAPVDNQPPVASAGADRSVLAGSEVVLDGSASRDADGQIVGYDWTQAAGTPVSLRDANRVRASFTAPAVGAPVTLRFSLQVTDDQGATASATVAIDVRPRPDTPNLTPVADAGPDQSVLSGAAVTLAGTASDPDGTIVTQAWTQTGGPEVALSGADGASPRFTAPTVTATTVLRFRYTVTDNGGATASDEVNVAVSPVSGNRPPVANAGADQTVDEGAVVTLDGSASADPDGSVVAYAWTQVAGPTVALSDAAAVRPQFTAPAVDVDTELRFSLQVTDNAGAVSAADDVRVIVRNTDGGNRPPVADAGADQAVNEGSAVTLDGSASSDPEAGALTYAWTQRSGPTVTLEDASTARARFTAPSVDADTALVFRLTVTDPEGASASDEVTITVRNVAAGLPVLAIDDAEVIEGDSGETPLRFRVRLTPASAVTVTVRARTSGGTATAGSDYVAADTTLSFAPGETERFFEVAVRGDTEVEGDETVLAQLSEPANATLGRAAATGTIRDDDEDEEPAPNGSDAELAAVAAQALLAGCDVLDDAHCLFPFPSNHFTAAAAAGTPQSVERGGTGRRINFNPLAMPRNAAGKPIDPTEWNRNDGYSPGQMILTYVPDIGTVKDDAGQPTGPIVGAPPITDIGRSLDIAGSSIVVLDAETGLPHPVWAEINLIAGFLLPADQIEQPNPLQPKRPAVVVRPAQNFIEGRRYVVVMKNLRNDAGAAIDAGAAFATCRDGRRSALPPVQQRCEALARDVFPVLTRAGIAVENNAALYLAWDFTVASTENTVARLRHMRDDAFLNYLGQQEDTNGAIVDMGHAPRFRIAEVVDNEGGDIARTVRGSITVPSYVLPSDPSPLEGNATLRAVIDALPAPLRDALSAIPADPFTASLPPNRLFYSPAGGTPGLDPSNLADPFNLRYGDGLPDRSGELSFNFTCNIPRSALATPGTARPSLYGHGLLGSQAEVGAGNVRTMGNDHNMLFCAADWFGFAFGDIPNVLTVLLDLSNFPVIPDASQQGMLNMMFLARLLRHPEGFAADPAFQLDGQPLFDRREVFYDGNSQGGILGGPVIALSKDIRRGVLGVIGMNYSTLLQRSVDFDGQLEPGIPPYSLPLYLMYQDDLDRDLAFSLIQMLWDRSENNGYAHHLTDNRALHGENKQVLLQPAFADHQVTHWSAHVMARSMNVEVADQYVRRPGESVPFTYADKFQFFAERDPDDAPFWNLPLVGRDAGAEYDSAPCTGTACRTTRSALIQFDEGRTATPPIGNVPPRADEFDPHGYPRDSRFGQCQKSHFLHSQGRIIDVRSARNVTGPGNCPALPPAVGVALPGSPATAGVFLCTPQAIPLAAVDCVDVATLPAVSSILPAPLNLVDGGLETLAAACRDNAGPLLPACVVSDGLAQLIQQGQVVVPPPVAGDNASCASATHLARGGHYQIELPSESGENISFQVYEPRGGIRCENGTGVAGAHPLILQGHGFGGSRSVGDDSFASYRDRGYAVISIDQRGFGDSTGTVRVMDPDFEGRDLVRILDWAEANLDYLAYRDDAGLRGYVPRPASGASTPNANLLVGAIGGSYGGGFQFLLHNVDDKNRLDALAPDITWHDLRYSLNPGDTLKSVFGLLLSAGGASGSYTPALRNQELPLNRGLDPFIVETLARAVATGEFPRDSLEWFRYHSPSYWCGLNGEPTMPYAAADHSPFDPNRMLGALLGTGPGGNTRNGQPGIDVLLSQGFRDTLFNFNEAWWNYQCAAVRGGDVRLVTHQSGHILDPGGLVGLPRGTPLDIQAPGGSENCGALNRGSATLTWLDQKLRGREPAAGNPLNATQNALCFSLADDDAVNIPVEHVLAPRAPEFVQAVGPAQSAYYAVDGVGASSVPQGVLAQTLYHAGKLTPSAVPLVTVESPRGVILAGIAPLTITLRAPGGLQDTACETARVPTLRTGCDAIVFVGLGLRRNGGAWQIIDDQLTPVRGLGRHTLELVGVGERLRQGDELALLVYGYHPQYLLSFSRDATVAAINVEADVELPLYAVGANGAPDYGAGKAAAAVRPVVGTGCTSPDGGFDPMCIAQGTAISVVRQLCDYQWLPGVCPAVAQPDPHYLSEDDPGTGALFLAIGAVHEHSSYSDGDPSAVPQDYFRAGRIGVNGGDSGVRLDFMFSSEHSDNEKLPVTTAASCVDPSGIPAGFAALNPTAIVPPLACSRIEDTDHYFKWQATLEQALAETERDGDAYSGFTAIRGFEYTNDYYNHLNVYFSTNVVNVKVDGSLVDLSVFWNWLRRPVAEGGGADALVTFNHPGGTPALSPFDGGLPHGDLLQATKGGANWNDLAYVDAEIDARVVGIEVNGGDDIEWYVKALTRGWHVGPVAAEDEHGRNWASLDDGKTQILTRGRSPRDYYHAFQNRRTSALRREVLQRDAQGKARVPQLLYWAGPAGTTVQEGQPLGSIVRAPGVHTLQIDFAGLPAGARIALLTDTTGAQAAPVALGAANADGAFRASRDLTAPTQGENWYFVVVCAASETNCGGNQNHLAVTAPIWFGPGGAPSSSASGYGGGLIGALAQATAQLNGAVAAALLGDFAGAGRIVADALTGFGGALAALPSTVDPTKPGTTLIGLHAEPAQVIQQLASARREVEPVVLTGDRLPLWSAPAAFGIPYPYPSGATLTGDWLPEELQKGNGRHAHNGQMLYPLPGAPMGVDVDRIVAYRYEPGHAAADANGFVEIPVQVDQRFPHFLANSASDFSTYSGTDEELSYQWDSERWSNDDPQVPLARYDDAPTPDPVTGLDHDDEVVFMARDAGTAMAPRGARPADVDAAAAVQQVLLADALSPATPRYAYLALKPQGARGVYHGRLHYVDYQHGAIYNERSYEPNQWIDRYFFRDDDPEKLGTRLTNYGPNREGVVQPGEAYYGNPGACTGSGAARQCASADRFPRDSRTVTTDTYKWLATGRWMIREIAIAKPGRPGVYGEDLLDRWKGRAFQQNPDSYINLIGGFEEEQTNWEANSTLLGERCGPVRCIREVWGADSGTNVTKTETFYRDVVTYRYRLRVHPIPPDGLYTSWDYNRSAMVSDDPKVPAGRYYTTLRPQGVPIDGVNDDIGQVDGILPFGGQCINFGDQELAPPIDGRCPMFFDVADPSFNLMLAFNNWEQVSAKGDLGSLVYLFEIKGATTLLTPLVVPYYRDDACFDDGTGDDPVPRPFPGEDSASARVRAAYSALNGGVAYEQLECHQRQGSHGSHGVHYFATGDVDNAFLLGKPINEVDGQQWQFMVPSAQPQNVGDAYANVVRVPLVAVVSPAP
ncbi:MAG TPA: PKD domain-containing protein [Solimonas sp.]